uniref:G protein-coupled receptor n=1 Tax=Caenorhabditis tropicalis TaxID=1561998 RepID=A0A1I7T6P3_9PELO
MFVHWSDYVGLYWDLVFNPITLIANLLLIAIILKHTPESTRTYAAIILLMSISDCVGAISGVMTVSRVVPMDPELLIIYRGACILFFDDDLEFKAQACQLWYTIIVESYMLNHIVLILSYIYRALIITRPFKIFEEKWVYVILCVYTLAHYSYFGWVHYMAMRPMSVVDEAIMKIRPEIIGSNMTYYAITDRSAPSQIVFYITSYLTPWVVILVAVICRWKIDRYLDQIVFSTSVRELQKSIGNIFYAQTIGPILLALISIFYVIYTFIGLTDGSRAVFENIMAKPLGLMYIVNPITTIYFVTPYRKAFLKYIRKGPVVILVNGPVSVLNTNSRTI